VALSGTTVVEVHNGSGTAGTMWWKVGQVQSNNTIGWGNSEPYDFGWNPSVALSGTTVVEVHNGSDAFGKMWYKVGQVESNNTIAWGNMGNSEPYDNGWNPRVALVDGSNIVEFHNGSGAAGPMWYHWGYFTGVGTINFGNATQYDFGDNPSVAVGSNSPVEVHNGGGTAGQMWWSVGNIQVIQ
jgi:hypothetical protein